MVANHLAGKVYRFQVNVKNGLKFIFANLEVGNWWIYSCSIYPDVYLAKPPGDPRYNRFNLFSLSDIGSEKSYPIRGTSPLLEVKFSFLLISSNQYHPTRGSPERPGHFPTEHAGTTDNNCYLVLKIEKILQENGRILFVQCPLLVLRHVQFNYSGPRRISAGKTDGFLRAFSGA